MAGVKPTGLGLEGNPPRRSPPPGGGVQHGSSAPPIAGTTGKPEAQSVPQSPNLTFNLKLFSPAKLPNWPSIDTKWPSIDTKWPSIDIIAVHGSRENVDSTWTWRKPTGSAKSDGTPPGNPASKQGESDATVPGGDASKSNLPAETVPQTNHKPREPDEKALDTSVPPEASVPQSGKAEKTMPEVKGPQSNISWEEVKQGSSKRRESKSTKHESGGEPPKRESRFQFRKPPPKKTASTEPTTEDSHRNSEQSPQRESPATVGTGPKSTPTKGTRKQSVANGQGGEPREPEKVNWLEDDKMLPTALPECRVLGFCYPTIFQANTPDQNVLESLAQEFLKVIEKRWEDDSHRRAPIIFIGHELGGLIIGKALSIADALPDPQKKSLLSLTAAVIFLATPFPDSGSKEGVVNQLTSKVLDTLGTGLDFVRGGRRQIPVHEVMDDTTELRQLRDSFADLAEKNGIPVVCFNSKSPDSSQPKPKEENTKFKSIELDKPTNEICKFRGRNDGDYVKVRTELREFVNRRQMRDAVLAEDDVVLKMLLNERRNVELQDEFGRTPLQIAVMNGRRDTVRDTVRLLLGQGTAKIDHRDKEGFTALHYAVSQAANKGHDDMDARNLITLLVEKGADVEMEDNDGRTAWEGRPTWLLYLKRHRALVEGASKPKTVGLKTPIALSTKEAITACMGFRATMMEFYYIGEGEKYLMEKASIKDLIYKSTKPDAILDLARPKSFDGKALCRWYHIPANNETWVQDLFAKLGVLLDPMREHRHEGYARHSRFMRPQVKKTEYWKQTTAKGLVPNSQQTTAKGLVPNSQQTTAEELVPNSQQTTAEGLVPNSQKPDETGKSDMMLYIPFLGFETSSSREQMAEFMRNMSAPRKTDSSKPDQRDDENLIKAYDEFLHPRRTLDQFYYLENRETRDKKQVIQSWLEGQDQSKTYVMMADQLWLWIINDNTVVTSFAEPWGESRERDSFDVLGGFIEYMKRKDRSPIKSGHDLAMKIVKHCLNAYNTCHPPGVEFHNVFEMFINSAANRETSLFEKFQSDSKKLAEGEDTLDSNEMGDLRDSLFYINDETDQLKDVKHILDELNIVLTMLKEQKDVLSKMSNYFPHISCPESIMDNNIKLVENNIKRADKMKKHAENTQEALNHLLNLKQKQANGWEARFARKQSEQSARQGNIILLFTIVTIIFLPLTFLASFFALNIAQFPKDSTGNSTEWQLSHISKYLFGVSFATSSLFILLVVNVNRVKEVWTHWDYSRDGDGRHGDGRDGGVRWEGFHSRIPFFSRSRRRREVDLPYISDYSSSSIDLEGPHYSSMSSTTVWSRDQVRDGTTGFDLDALERGVGLHRRGKERISESENGTTEARRD